MYYFNTLLIITLINLIILIYSFYKEFLIKNEFNQKFNTGKIKKKNDEVLEIKKRNFFLKKRKSIILRKKIFDNERGMIEKKLLHLDIEKKTFFRKYEGLKDVK